MGDRFDVVIDLAFETSGYRFQFVWMLSHSRLLFDLLVLFQYVLRLWPAPVTSLIVTHSFSMPPLRIIILNSVASEAWDSLYSTLMFDTGHRGPLSCCLTTNSANTVVLCFDVPGHGRGRVDKTAIGRIEAIRTCLL